ncbi:CLUMA_CG009092, isoform A [Clunio marinus]|uniref:Ribosome biogenesis regulatory protein n=1 Tax=Clunio marinus TaxID=568069 RepID=A0A1J1I7B0_9DIPT|nr:CLUMA_CG009092, isoform A [Clunio marinus]
MDIVKEVLAKQAKDLEKYKTINVEKHEEVKVDLGHLMISDPNNFDENALRDNVEQYLLNLTRENVQLLVNGIWELQTERLDEHIVAKLPKASFALPRARKLPQPKVPTKWEQFAKAKGIKKRQKDKKVWDEELGKWVATYGFQRFKAEKEKDWVLEVPQNLDPMTDMFQKKKDLKSERVAKNEIARMKNIARAQKVQVPRAGFVSEESASAKDLHVAATIAKSSTASVGKFQEKLPKEKDARGIGVRELIPGSKRKRTIDPSQEKSQQIEVVQRILNKRPKIDVDKAVQIQKREAREEREKNPIEKKRTGSKSKHAKKFSSKKPKGAMGNRKPKKGGAGRKRR